MKALCVELDINKSLTIGNVYEIKTSCVNSGKLEYLIVNDLEYPKWYDEKLFVVTDGDRIN